MGNKPSSIRAIILNNYYLHLNITMRICLSYFVYDVNCNKYKIIGKFYF